MKRSIEAGLLALAAVLAACSKAPAAKPASPPKVVVIAAQQQDEPIYRQWIGTTEGDVNAEIRPKVDGYLLRRSYQEGSFVHEGQLLFEIDPRQSEAQLAQAQANLEQANAGLAKAQHDVTRYEPLVAQKAISQQEVDNARSAERAAEASVAAAKAAVEQARLNRAWTSVTSPISGIAGIAQAQVGDLVSPQSVLTTVSKVDPIRVRYEMSEQEYLQYQKDPQMHNAQLQLILADGSTYPHAGKILLSGREVDVKTGTIATIGLFPNPGNVLRPGEYAKIRAITQVRRGAVVVPQRAVNEMQDAYQIGVVGPDNKVEVRTVKAGDRVGSNWIIDEGLKPGERVITEGFSRVKDGQTVVPVEGTGPDTTEKTSSMAAPLTPASRGEGGQFALSGGGKRHNRPQLTRRVRGAVVSVVR